MNNPILLFQINDLQVYHFPTHDEVKYNSMPNKVYWQDVVLKQTFGPFNSLSSAMMHRTYFIATNKHPPEDPPKNVINVDFINKKRVEPL